MIIVIEGSDGCGKQTQTKLLYDYLVKIGKNVKTFSFPNYNSDSSMFVKKYLHGELGGLETLTPKQCSTFFALDRFITMKDYKDYLSSGGILLLDRYVSSNMLHQACKIDDETERLEFLNWLEKYEYEDLQIPKADVVIYLDLKPSISKKLRENRTLKVGGQTDIHEQNEEYMIKCYNRGKDLAKLKKWKTITCYNNEEIKTIDEIHNEIINLLNLA